MSKKLPLAQAFEVSSAPAIASCFMRVLHLAWLLCLGLGMGEVQNLRGAQAPEGKTAETSEAEKPESTSTEDVGAVVQEAKETPTPTQKEPEVGAVAKEPAEPVKGEQSPVSSSPEAPAKPVAKGGKDASKDAPPIREVVYVPVDAWEAYEYPYDDPYDPYDSDEALDEPLTEYAPDFDPDVDEVEEVKGTGKEAAVAAGTATAAAANAAAVTAGRAEKLRWGRRPIRRWGRRPYRRPYYRPRPYWRPYYRPRYCLKWAWGRCVWWGR